MKNSMADTEQVLKMDPNNVEAKARKDRLNKILEIKANQKRFAGCHSNSAPAADAKTVADTRRSSLVQRSPSDVGS